jgi:hypothetical protein
LFSLGSFFFKITEGAQILVIRDVLVLTKMSWVSFWAIFPQTHLVTLLDRVTLFEAAHVPKFG